MALYSSRVLSSSSVLKDAGFIRIDDALALPAHQRNTILCQDASHRGVRTKAVAEPCIRRGIDGPLLKPRGPQELLQKEQSAKWTEIAAKLDSRLIQQDESLRPLLGGPQPEPSASGRGEESHRPQGTRVRSSLIRQAVKARSAESETAKPGDIGQSTSLRRVGRNLKKAAEQNKLPAARSRKAKKARGAVAPFLGASVHEEVKQLLQLLEGAALTGLSAEEALSGHVDRLQNFRIFSALVKELSHPRWGVASLGALQALLSAGGVVDSRMCAEVIRALGRSGHPSAAGWLLSKMQQRSEAKDEQPLHYPAPNLWTYNSLMSAYCIAGRLKDAEALMAQMRGVSAKGPFRRERETDDERTAVPKPDVVTYNTLINGCNMASRWDSAVEAWRQMQADGVEPDQHTCNVVFAACAKGGKGSLSSEILMSMQHHLISLDDFGLGSLVQALGVEGKWQQAMDVVMAARSKEPGFDSQPSVKTYNALIYACGHCQQFEAAMQVAQWMQADGLHWNTVTYNSLLSACRKAGRPQEALRYYKQMQQSNVLPDSTTWTLLIAAQVEHECYEDALDLFWESRVQTSRRQSRSYTPDVRTYNAVLTACGRGRLWTEALEVFEDMKHSGCEPDSLSYTLLIDALGKSGELDRALTVFQKMRDKRIPVDIRTLNVLLSACAVTARCEEASEVFKSVSLLGLRPTVVTYNALLRCYRRGGQAWLAVSAIQRMLKTSCEPDATTFREVLAACEGAGLSSDAVWLLDGMRQREIPLRGMEYARAIRACVKGQEWQEALELFHTMEKEGCQPDAAAYLAVLEVLERPGQWQAALCILDKYEAHGVTGGPGVEAYNLALGACVYGKAWSQAVSLVSRMKAAGCRPNMQTYAMLVEGLKEAERWEDAMAVYSSIPMRKVVY